MPRVCAHMVLSWKSWLSAGCEVSVPCCCAVVTVLAGYWNPSILTRFWLTTFFVTVRLQQRFGFVESYLSEH